ncbi:YlaH-like family protein [Bacillus sp. AFS041924]|uniref:YlaH-like family protein n=1 Tax=Bacillus sp. AFS041924 TaxID=2033503 RepID=UPI0020D286B6|nr:YlaH-like family protein [Bacillus sp. AFS041924]
MEKAPKGFEFVITQLINITHDVGLSMWILYALIVVLSIVVYHLGFAKKLSILKMLITYVLLMIGCSFLTFLALRIPIVEALLASVFVLGVYKVRLHQSKKNKATT